MLDREILFGSGDWRRCVSFGVPVVILLACCLPGSYRNVIDRVEPQVLSADEGVENEIWRMECLCWSPR